MSNEEALNKFRITLQVMFNESESDIEAVKFAIAALEKQIPKKPYFGSYYWATWTCPCCRTRYEIDYEQHKHCPECGQAIDWGEKND